MTVLMTSSRSIQGDALLAGVPMVVLPRETLASRVSASLAFAAPSPSPPHASAGGREGGGAGVAVHHAGVVVARNVADYVALTLALVAYSRPSSFRVQGAGCRAP